MTLQLAVLALCGTLDPGRIKRAVPADPQYRRPALAVGLAAVVVLVAVFAWLSGPVLGALGVSEPNARIAAGIGLLVVAARDLLASAPNPEPGLTGRWAGLVPIAFPVAFTPATTAMAIASGADLGVVMTVVATTPALALVAVVGLAPIPETWLTWVSRSTALFAAIIGVVVTLDGVRAI